MHTGTAEKIHQQQQSNQREKKIKHNSNGGELEERNEKKNSVKNQEKNRICMKSNRHLYQI